MKYENPFDEIVKQHYNSIYRYCYVRLGKECDAYDCTQEVFVILCQKADKLNINENIRAWLYRTADNVMRNFKRKNNKYISFEELPEIPVETDFSVETPFNEAISENEYQLLKAYYIDKENIEHIAKELDITKDAAFKRIYRIKAKIIKHIEEFNNKR